MVNDFNCKIVVPRKDRDDDVLSKVADSKEIGDRIRARLAAEEVASLADGEAEVHGKHFWKCLHDICCAHVHCKVEEALRKKRQDECMSDGEVQRFDKELVPFEAFRGKMVKDVPLDRLEWYADQTFVDQLRRYLRSKRVKHEAENE